MCPVVFLALGLTFLLLLLELSSAFQNVTFIPNFVNKLEEGQTKEIGFYFSSEPSENILSATIYCEQPDIAEITSNTTFYFDPNQKTELNGTFNLRGKFLGFAAVRLSVKVRKNEGNVDGNGDGSPTGKVFSENSTRKDENVDGTSDGRVTGKVLPAKLPISVVRKNSILSKVFIVSVAVLVSLNYINMGCALDLAVVKTVLVRPIAPVLGIMCQFIVMPLVAYGLGQTLFRGQHDLQLGLFTFGCSPGGGASNMWTVLLAGNLNLSITLTFISTAAALLLMPFWLFTLGSILFKASLSSIPFTNIITSLISMVVPLGIGLLIQRFKPKIAQFCRRIIAPASIIMIIYIIIFGTYSNLYMFKLMDWRIFLAASLNVWLGFLAGLAVAKTFRLSTEDTIAISIETGVQNTGISIVLLGFSLGQPSADLASVVPVAASIMTPLPLLVALVVKKLYACYRLGNNNGDGRNTKGYVNGNNGGEEEDFKEMVNSPTLLSSIAADDKVHTNGLAIH